VLVPAGPFLMGSDGGAGVAFHEKPQDTVELPAYHISIYPITNANYLEYVRQTRAAVDPAMGWVLAPVGQEPPAETENHPVVGVSWDEAMASR